MPTTIRQRHKSRIASTANGIGNLFHSLWSDPDKYGLVTHETPLILALEAGMDVDLLDCWSTVAKADKRLFDQIFNCRFLDGVQQYIPSSSISACETDNLYVAPRSGVWYAGLDVGRSNDLTALVVIHFDGQIATVRAIVTAKRTDHTSLLNLVRWAFATWPIQRLAVDSTGMGTFPVDEMKRIYGKTRVEAVHFTDLAKESMATTMYSSFVDGWIRIPSVDSATKTIEQGGSAALQRDLASLKRIILPSGNIRYDAVRNSSGHADRAWALGLALDGITNRPGSFKRKFDGQAH